MQRSSQDLVAILVEDEGKKRRFLLPRKKAEGFIYLIEEFELNNERGGFFHDIFFQIDQKKDLEINLLREIRLERGLTQKELGESLDIPQNHISAMECGRRPIGKKMAKRLAEVLGVNYRTFL
ncbi:MAG: helix-turn-helix transcriptional regulator [Bacteriovoracales bacterium]|nr:helix-turn-helix transcriptional regulator [Bacteriovoracales bacterium]